MGVKKHSRYIFCLTLIFQLYCHPHTEISWADNITFFLLLTANTKEKVIELFLKAMGHLADLIELCDMICIDLKSVICSQ